MGPVALLTAHTEKTINLGKSIADCNNEALEIDLNLLDGNYYRALDCEALNKTDEATTDFNK